MGADKITLFMTSFPYNEQERVEQILQNSKIPRNPGGIEPTQTVCTRLFFFFCAHAQEPGNEATPLCG